MTGMRADDPEFVRTVRQQADLRADIHAVQHYGADVPDTWAGMWVDNHPDPVRIIVAVTGEPDVHGQALRQRLRHPDQLDVLQVRFSLRELESVRDEIAARAEEYGMRSLGVDIPSNTVAVGLAPGNDSAAAELRGRHGDRVRTAASHGAATAD